MARLNLLALLIVVGALALVLGACSDPGGNGVPVFPDASGGDSGFGTCEPSCFFKTCGDDGCGGTCGTCGDGDSCEAFRCVTSDGTPTDPIDTPDAVGSADGTGETPDAGATPDAATSPQDQDGDGVLSNVDNCPQVFNPTQEDTDKDFLGNACDPDIDGDGYPNEQDCDPLDPEIHPGSAERCGDGIDNNCNGQTDEPDALGCSDFYVDGDLDGSGLSETKVCLCQKSATHTVTVAGDCDDTTAAFGALTPETCDGIDNNCNLLVDEGCDDDADGWCDAAMTVVGSPAVCPNGGGDCLDYSALVHPGATEIESNGLDDDCDGDKAGEAGGPIADKDCPTICLGNTVEAALCAVDICYPSLVQNAAFSSPTNNVITNAWKAIAHYGSSFNDLAPFAAPSYLIMGTGTEPDTSHQDSLPTAAGFGSWDDPYSNDGFSTFDAVEFTIDLVAPAGATGFSIDYIFMSAEYEEWIGDDYNDKFYIILQASQTTGGQSKVINSTKCSNPSVYKDGTDENGQPYCFIAINTAFSEKCPFAATDISGTGHDCFSDGSSTGWLTTQWPIVGGESMKLTFHIHDTSDNLYDSTVLIDNFQWLGGLVTGGTASHN